MVTGLPPAFKVCTHDAIDPHRLNLSPGPTDSEETSSTYVIEHIKQQDARLQQMATRIEELEEELADERMLSSGYRDALGEEERLRVQTDERLSEVVNDLSKYGQTFDKMRTILDKLDEF